MLGIPNLKTNLFDNRYGQELHVYLDGRSNCEFVYSLNKLHFLVVDGKLGKIISLVRNRRYSHGFARIELILFFAFGICHNDFAAYSVKLLVESVIADFDNTLGTITLKDENGMEKAVFRPNETVKVEVKANEGHILSNISVEINENVVARFVADSGEKKPDAGAASLLLFTPKINIVANTASKTIKTIKTAIRTKSA